MNDGKSKCVNFKQKKIAFEYVEPEKLIMLNEL